GAAVALGALFLGLLLVVALVRARADVRGRRLAGREAAAVAPDAPRLLRVAEEQLAGRVGEPERVGDVGVPVAVPVDLDVVPGALRERVVVRPRRRVLAR